MADDKNRGNGRFGSRYGSRIRKKVSTIEQKYKFKSQECPFCGEAAASRIAIGIYSCSKCSKKFTGGAYETNTAARRQLSKYFDKYGNVSKRLDLGQIVSEESKQ